MKSAIAQERRATRPYANGEIAPSLENARIAIVHYWFVAHRGGERVVEAVADMFPKADLFTLIADPEAMSKSLRQRSLHTSFLQKLPGSKRLHRHLLPLYPMA